MFRDFELVSFREQWSSEELATSFGRDNPHLGTHVKISADGFCVLEPVHNQTGPPRYISTYLRRLLHIPEQMIPNVGVLNCTHLLPAHLHKPIDP